MGIWALTLVWVLATLAWTALCAAWLGKTKKVWLYWLLLTPWLLWLIGASTGLAVLSYLMSQKNIAPSYMPHAVTFAVLLAVGSLTIVIAGNRRRDGRLAAGSWPALRLFLAWIGLCALHMAVIWYLDTGVRSEMDQAREQINGQYAALLEPVPEPQSNAADLYAEAFAQISSELVAADAAEEQRFYDELAKRDEAAAATENPDTEMDDEPAPATKPSELISLGNVDDPRIAPLVKSLEPAIQKLREASLRPVCRSDQNQEPPDIGRALPSLANYRTAAQLLRCHAAIEARANRFSSAMEDVDALHRMGRHVQQTTVGLVPFLVGVGIDTLADQALAEILPYANASVSLPAADLSHQVLNTEVRAALMGEHAFEVRTVLDFCDGRLLSSTGISIPQRAAMTAMPYRILYLRADLTAFRQMHEALIARLDGVPVPQEAAWTARGGTPPGGLLSHLLIPSLNNILNKTCPNKQALTRAAVVAAALTNYRIDTGHYPASLDELVPKYLPAVPTDPLDGKPILYLLRDKQATIYSVGDDRIDDGGRLDRKDDQPHIKTLDIGMLLKARAGE